MEEERHRPEFGRGPLPDTIKHGTMERVQHFVTSKSVLCVKAEVGE